MKSKTKKTPAAASPRFRVIITATAAEFFHRAETEPYSRLAYGAPGSDAFDKAEGIILALKEGNPGNVVITRR